MQSRWLMQCTGTRPHQGTKGTTLHMKNCLNAHHKRDLRGYQCTPLRCQSVGSCSSSLQSFYLRLFELLARVSEKLALMECRNMRCALYRQLKIQGGTVLGVPRTLSFPDRSNIDRLLYIDLARRQTNIAGCSRVQILHHEKAYHRRSRRSRRRIKFP